MLDLDPAAAKRRGHELWAGRARVIRGKSAITRHGVRFTLDWSPGSEGADVGSTTNAKTNPVVTWIATWEDGARRKRRWFNSARSAAAYIKRHRSNGTRITGRFDLAAGWLRF